MIKSVVLPENQFVNYGPCFLNDTLQIKFFVKNTGNKPIIMEPFRPTFFLGLSPNDPTMNQFNLFRRFTPLPRTFISNESDTIRINFDAGDTLVSRTGWHEALFAVSFLPAENPEGPTISKIDTFFLRVKKTPYFVSGFDDLISFDSVYVKPNNLDSKIWRVKNVWTNNQKIIGLDRRLITQPVTNPEFTTADLPTNIEIYPDSIIYLPINYYPLNRGLDSMFLKLNYKPLPALFPDSVDYAWTSVRGIGVEQEIRISKSNYNWVADTIDLGDVNVLDNTEIEINIKNYGNLPFGIIGQKVLNINNSLESNYFSINEKFADNNLHIQPDAESKAILKFNPASPGYYQARIQIESDILNRNIKGVQPDKRYKYLYIKANVLSPVLALQVSEVDFGNLIVNNSCISERDTNITIYNTGNTDLFINSITFTPDYPDNPFFSRYLQLIVPPNQSADLGLSFKGKSGDFNTYSAKLILVSNQSPPKDTVRINVFAKSVPPISALLSIPQNVKSKPGTLIEIPIILKSDSESPANFAKYFKSTLVYNRSILEFAGVRTLGTALEGTNNLGDLIEKDDKNELQLDFQTISNNYFLAKDTLLFLKFKTYLGNSPSTELTIVSPKFGDGNCNEVFTLTSQNGSYMTDSVCGIDFKALPALNGKFDLKLVYDNHNIPSKAEFELPYSTTFEFQIFDSFGNQMTNNDKVNLNAGIYQITLDLNNLPSGIYFTKMITPAYQIIKGMTLIK